LIGAMVIGCVAIGAAALIMPSRLHEAVIAPFGMVIVLGSLVAGVLRWREGSRVARYFVTAWGFFLAGAVIYFVKSTGLLPHTPTTEHAMQVGSALEMVLLSLALADRVRTVELDAHQKEHRLALARAEHASAVEALRADAARRMIEAQDEHSRRLARDLHDSVGHRFLLIEYAAADPDDDEVRSAIVALAREGAADTREIAHGLYPQRLLDVGLTGALQSAADVVTRAGLRLDFDADERATTRLGEAERLAVLRVAEEALHNALRHADASRIGVSLTMKTGAVVLEVIDDGAGIAVGAADGLGMRTMRERAAHVGAHLVVEHDAPGGTVVRMMIPGP
jgi:signal transduction histidine kinase